MHILIRIAENNLIKNIKLSFLFFFLDIKHHVLNVP
jgi:hypothetical protein